MNRVDSLPGYPETQGSTESRERLAWAVLLAAFFAFVFLALSIPLSARWYLQNATRAWPATVQGSSGTTLVVMPNVADPFAVLEGLRKDGIEEGSAISTDGTSQAVLTLFDRSQITVYPNSEVKLRRLRQPRFGHSTRPSEILIEVTRGRVRVGVLPFGSRPILFQMRTPQALATLEPGSFAIEVNNDMSHIVVRGGRAQVSGQTGPAVTVPEGKRSDVRLAQAASAPLEAARNLIANGTFEKPLSAVPLKSGLIVEQWSVYNDQGGDGGTTDGIAEVGIWGNRRAIRLYRTNSTNNHGVIGIKQELANKYVADYRSLRLRLDVNIVSQSLSGGGQQSSEFPIIVRVNYRDRYGNENHWIHGFYYQNPQNYHIENGQLIPRDTWYSYPETDLKAMIPELFYLNSIQIYASGWDYEAFVSDVGIIAE